MIKQALVAMLLLVVVSDAWSIPWNISGFIRQELAYRISSSDNVENQ